MGHSQSDLEHVLNQMQGSAASLRLSSLPVLSDLDGERLDRFCATFDLLPAERRRRLVQSLIELAEGTFEVDFQAILRHCLHDADASTRALAVEGLWEDSSTALADTLLSLLHSDPSPRVRAAAARGLGSFALAGQMEALDAPTAGRILQQLLATVNLVGEAPEVRRRALESAAHAGSPEVSEALEVAYEEGDEEMRISAVLAMGRTCDPRWTEILLEELESNTPAMRYQAIVACGEIGLPRSVSQLGKALHDPDQEIAEAAIWALGQIGGSTARNLLLDMYPDADEETQAAIDDALAEQDLLEGMSSFSMVDFADSDDLEWLLDDEDGLEDGIEEDGLAEAGQDE